MAGNIRFAAEARRPHRPKTSPPRHLPPRAPCPAPTSEPLAVPGGAPSHPCLTGEPCLARAEGTSRQDGLGMHLQGARQRAALRHGIVTEGGAGDAGSVERSGIEPGPRARGDARRRPQLTRRGCSFAPTGVSLAAHVEMGGFLARSMARAVSLAAAFPPAPPRLRPDLGAADSRRGYRNFAEPARLVPVRQRHADPLSSSRGLPKARRHVGRWPVQGIDQRPVLYPESIARSLRLVRFRAIRRPSRRPRR
jgi:hypothetical protein